MYIYREDETGSVSYLLQPGLISECYGMVVIIDEILLSLFIVQFELIFICLSMLVGIVLYNRFFLLICYLALKYQERFNEPEKCSNVLFGVLKNFLRVICLYRDVQPHFFFFFGGGGRSSSYYK